MHLVKNAPLDWPGPARPKLPPSLTSIFSCLHRRYGKKNLVHPLCSDRALSCSSTQLVTGLLDHRTTWEPSHFWRIRNVGYGRSGFSLVCTSVVSKRGDIRAEHICPLLEPVQVVVFEITLLCLISTYLKRSPWLQSFLCVNRAIETMGSGVLSVTIPMFSHELERPGSARG